MYFQIFTFFLLSLEINAFYGEDILIADLTSDNFNKLVANSKDLWLVEFYAPWCSHCQTFAGEYRKVAKVLRGMVKVGAVDGEKHPQLSQYFNVESYPTVKVFNSAEEKITNYHGGISTNDVVSFVIGIIQKKVKTRLSITGDPAEFKSEMVEEFTKENLDEVVLGSKEAWLVVFYHPHCEYCKILASLWPKVADSLSDNSMLKMGAIDGNFYSAKALAYKVREWPTILFFPIGKKNISSGIKYTGLNRINNIVDWINEQVLEQSPPPELFQITNLEILKEACAKRRLCILSFFPHILDCTAECRNEYLNTLKNVSFEFKNMQWGWVWSEGNVQPDLEKVLHIGEAGYPALVAVSVKKMRFATFVGSFSSDGIKEFLRRLSSGKGETVPITAKELPKIHVIDSWSGEDVADTGAEISKDEL